MAENSAIEWTHHTFNPWIGCTKVSPACDNCYAERDMDHRFGRVVWGAGQERSRTSAANWRKPLKWNEEAQRTGQRVRVFCASLADVFDPEAPPAWRFDLFSLIASTPNLDWLLLTKRPANAKRFYDFMPRNIWMGASIENQDCLWARAKYLADWPGITFWSCEPLLGLLHLPASVPALLPNWIIVGGESGPNYRPFNADWARNIQVQCKGLGIAFFMKQLSGPTKAVRSLIPPDLLVREYPTTHIEAKT